MVSRATSLPPILSTPSLLGRTPKSMARMSLVEAPHVVDPESILTWNTILQRSTRVRRANQRAFGAAAVGTGDLAFPVGRVRGKDFRLEEEQLLFVRRELAPAFQKVIGLRRELGAPGAGAEPFLWLEKTICHSPFQPLSKVAWR